MKVSQNGLSYILDETNYTAKVIKSPYAYGRILIPRSINYNGKDFVIQQLTSDSFQGNQNVISISFSLDSEVKTISRNAFKQSALKSLSLPKSIEQLEDGWCRSTSIEQITISPDNPRYKVINNIFLISIQDEITLVFACRNIKTTTIPSNITVFGEFSFECCNSLKTLIFSEDSQLKKISKNAFTSCSLREMIIPPNLEFIDEKWNKTSYLIEKVEISPKNDHFSFEKNQFLLKLNKKENTSILYFALHGITQVFIPSNVTKILNHAFQNCQSIQTVTFEENSILEEIGERSFQNCKRLAEINIPKSVKTIGKFAFCDCDNLNAMTIKMDSKLMKIGDNLISYSQISELFLPDSLQVIEEGWCYGADSLNHIQINASHPNFLYFDEKILIDKKNGLLLFANKDIESCIVPATVKKIGKYAFENCMCLTSLHFEDPSNSMLTEIGECAFYFCSHLSGIEKVPSNLRIIGKFAFSGCSEMTIFELNSDSKLEKICERAFDNCNFTSFYIPGSLHIIESGWYQSICELNDITVSKDNQNFIFTEDKLLLHRKSDTEKNFDEIVFVSQCTKSVVIQDSIRKIEDCAFQNCSKLISVGFQNSSNSKLQKIGNSSFFDCTNLSFIEPFPESVDFFGRYCFCGIDKLNSVEFLGSEIYFSEFCFDRCPLVIAGFPNSTDIYVNLLSFTINDDGDDFALFIHCRGRIHQSY